DRGLPAERREQPLLFLERRRERPPADEPCARLDEAARAQRRVRAQEGEGRVARKPVATPVPEPLVEDRASERRCGAQSRERDPQGGPVDAGVRPGAVPEALRLPGTCLSRGFSKGAPGGRVEASATLPACLL